MTASKEIMEKLHALVADELFKRLHSGEATAAEFAQAIKFLKDNGIEAIPTPGSELEKLAGSITTSLPFSDPLDPVAH